MLLEFVGTFIFNVALSRSMTGRKDKVCGQIGVSNIEGTAGCTIALPAESEYAVLPVGVATIKPSACTRVNNLSL